MAQKRQKIGIWTFLLAQQRSSRFDNTGFIHAVSINSSLVTQLCKFGRPKYKKTKTVIHIYENTKEYKYHINTKLDSYPLG